MVLLRNRPEEALYASFGLALALFLLMPTQAGEQGVAEFAPPTIAARAREHLIASPFGTIHAAMFQMPRPIGTQIPEQPRVRLASLEMTGDIVGSIGNNAPRRDNGQASFPSINRARKGDRLVPGIPERVAPAAGETAPPPVTFHDRPKAAELELNDHSNDEIPDAQSVVLAELARDAQRRNAPPQRDEIAAAMTFEPFPEYDISLSLEMDPKISRRRCRRSYRSRSDRIYPKRATEP